MSRVLLVAPGFRGYWRSVATALERREHQVDTVVYDELASSGAKVRHKLSVELPERAGLDRWPALRRAATARVVEALRESRPEIVVVVRGDALDDSFWSELDRRRLPRVTWIYDEIERMHYPWSRLTSIGPVASYSPSDTARLLDLGVCARHLPDAFDQHVPVPRLRGHEREVVFIGARYGRREHDLLCLRDAGVVVRAVGRDWSHHPWDRARTWSWRRPELLATRDVPLATALGMQANAAAALNVHDRQDGFTMRTYEIPGAGGVQLIDRPDVESVYEPGTEVLVYRNDDELRETARRVVDDPGWTRSIRVAGRRRTLAEHTFDHRVSVLEKMWSAWG